MKTDGRIFCDECYEKDGKLVDAVVKITRYYDESYERPHIEKYVDVLCEKHALALDMLIPRTYTVENRPTIVSNFVKEEIETI
ncbi:MAG: hypothetical protein QXH07_02430 [Thermoplasmata archaeon]